MQAEKLLRSYPWRCAALESAKAELECPLHATDLAKPRVSFSGYSDTTAYAATDLAELSQIEAKLKLIRQWIDVINDHQERRLLISVWRSSRANLPWKYVAGDAKLHPAKALLAWQAMVDRLETHMGGVDGERYPNAS